MANRDRDGDLRAEIPEGDYADQLTPVDPVDHEDHEDPPRRIEPADHASDADWIEQQRVVPLEDDNLEAGPGAED